MNKRRKEDGEIGGSATRVIQVPSQATTTGIQTHVNPVGLKNGEVRTMFVQMN